MVGEIGELNLEYQGPLILGPIEKGVETPAEDEPQVSSLYIIYPHILICFIVRSEQPLPSKVHLPQLPESDGTPLWTRLYNPPRSHESHIELTCSTDS